MLPMSQALERQVYQISYQTRGARTGHIRTFRLDGRHLFHYLATHHVYSNTATAVLLAPIALHSAVANRSQSCAFPFRRSRRRQHVFCLAFLHPAQRTGDAGRPIHVHGLHQSRPAVTNHHGHCHGVCTPSPIPVLTDGIYSPNCADISSIRLMDEPPSRQ